ncbi:MULTISPECIES: hypothetical protein [unclassified Duganella]|uniref:hypothetical protein n=1 Tax=unclassified Duganella TaxID=2636909 RepID=UPI000888C7AB|nr:MULTISPECIES: hypothetical protein [unclassified Duganella]SDH28313.1 hypothetical protein SAMN05216320_111195 [Duganella sp. OV458]SDK39210.1 hypothetical protein SAMN05428973_11149 [Duganella sp. OV510]
MKSFSSALLLMVCLGVAGNVPAEARPASHSGTSSSFKKGFSSQKSNSAARHSKPAAPPANRQSGPGAFGKQAGSPAQPQRNTSAMSRDVDRGAAEANALKTLDQRRNATTNQPLPPLNDRLRQPQPPSPVDRAPASPAPGPGYQQQASGNGNGLMAGVLGFMLGRAMSQSHQPVSYPTTNGSQPAAQHPAVAGPATADSAMVGGMPGLGDTAPAAMTPTTATTAQPGAAMTSAAAPAPPFSATVLRWFAWLSVLSLLGWAAVYSVRKFRRLRTGPNYSFERN